jgi:hypothetical protein
VVDASPVSPASVGDLIPKSFGDGHSMPLWDYAACRNTPCRR